MHRLFVRKVIACPPQRVWAVLSDVQAWPSWCPTVHSVRLLSSEMGPGAAVRIVQPGIRPATWWVREWNVPTGFAWESRHPGVRVVGDHRILPRSVGCEVELSLTFSGWLFRLLGKALLPRALRYLTRELDALASECSPISSAKGLSCKS